MGDGEVDEGRHPYDGRPGRLNCIARPALPFPDRAPTVRCVHTSPENPAGGHQNVPPTADRTSSDPAHPSPSAPVPAAGASQPAPAPDEETRTTHARLAESSDVAWVGPEGGPHRPCWFAWHRDAVWLLVDGPEQPRPAPLPVEGLWECIWRSKAQRARQLRVACEAEVIRPNHPAYDAALKALASTRHNVDRENPFARWHRESFIVRLVPAAPASERPGHMPTGRV